MTPLKAALDYAKKGIPVFPCVPNKKNPYLKTGFKEASTVPATIRTWWRDWPDAWIGVPTGKASGFVVLDIDIKRGRKGKESLKAQLNGSGLPKTKKIKTVSGGEHYYFNSGDQDIRNFKGKNGSQFDGIDVRGEGGYVIVPPSPGYSTEVDIDIRNLPPAPSWVANLKLIAAGGASKEPIKGGKLGPSIGVGERDDTFFLHARKLAEAGMTEAEAVGALAVTLKQYTEDNPHDPFTLADVRKKVKSAYRSEYRKGERAVVEPETVGEGGTFKTITATELLKKKFKPIKWAVEGLLPEGLAILGGRPKSGKTRFAFMLAIAVEAGTKFMDHFPTTKSEVLYLAADERSERLAAMRMKEMGLKISDGLHLCVESIPFLGEGFEEYIHEAMKKYPKIGLIIIDTWAKVKPPRKRGEDPYEHDGKYMEDLQGLQRRYKNHILIVHHTRKGGADNPEEALLGSTAISGGPDTILALTPQVGQFDGAQITQLSMTSRVCRSRHYDSKNDLNSPKWEFLGESSEHRVTEAKLKMWEIFTKVGEELTAVQVAELTGKSITSVRRQLHRMVKNGELKSRFEGRTLVYCHGYTKSVVA